MKDPQKSIFSWNHISDKLTEEEIKELKSYYQTYHQKCWVYKQAFKRYKSLNFIGNSISILTASGGIASAVATGGISLIAISTVSLLIKGYMEHQSLNLKIQNCQYAFQNYNHLLIIIKDAMRSGNFNEEALINSMNNVDNYVTDNSPIVDKFIKKYKKNINSLINY